MTDKTPRKGPKYFERLQSESSSGDTSESRTKESNTPTQVDLQAWQSALLAPFTKVHGLIGMLLLVPMLYWFKMSWDLALGDGKWWENLIGFFSGFLACLVVIPAWITYLGVIASDRLAAGLGGRFSIDGLRTQALLLLPALPLLLPGAILCGLTMSSLAMGICAFWLMLPAGLYFLTCGLVEQTPFSWISPAVSASIRRRSKDWALAFGLTGGVLVVGTIVVLIVGGPGILSSFVFALAMTIGSTLYGAIVGKLSDLASDDSREN